MTDPTPHMEQRLRRYILQPEVPGELAETAEVEHPPGQPMVVRKLVFALDSWLGDDLVTSHPVFMVTERLAAALRDGELTGFELVSMVVEKGDLWDEWYADRPLPELVWLKPTDASGMDFRMTASHDLEVSERALKVLRGFQLKHCDVEPVGSLGERAQ